jgi:hypothetical protein
MWLTSNAGGSWNQVPGVTISHGGGQLYRAPNGSFFFGTGGGVMYSANGSSWALVQGTSGNIQGIAGDGTNVWAGSAFPWGVAQRGGPDTCYYQALLSDPTHWAPIPGAPQLASCAASMAYDPDHKILYSANYWEGLWRYRVP